MIPVVPQATRKRDRDRAERAICKGSSRSSGVSHTTIYQIIKGRPVDLETANKVCKWLGVSIASAVDDPATNDTIAATLSVILRHVPELGAVFTEAAKELEAGTMTEEDFQAVVEFAAFQIQKRKEQAKKNVRSDAPARNIEPA